jgi:hypothetical protein
MRRWRGVLLITVYAHACMHRRRFLHLRKRVAARQGVFFSKLCAVERSIICSATIYLTVTGSENNKIRRKDYIRQSDNIDP